MNSGIYCIENLVNGKMYIGKASNLKKRKSIHFAELRGNYHRNNYLQNSYNKYGEENFNFYVIEYCEKKRLSEKEIKYIRIFDTYCNGYNMTLGGEGSFGLNVSEETREKLSKATSGKNNPFYGKHHSEETKEKISKANSGENHPGFGKHHSEKTREKMSRVQSGENGHKARLIKEQVFEILDLYYNKKEIQKNIAKKYGVSNGAISGICCGRKWKSCYKEFMVLYPNHSDLRDQRSHDSRLTEKQAFEILDLYYNKKERQVDIAKRYNMDQSTMSYVCRGKTWKSCYKEFMESQGR